jgi:hypothetical protein
MDNDRTYESCIENEVLCYSCGINEVMKLVNSHGIYSIWVNGVSNSYTIKVNGKFIKYTFSPRNLESECALCHNTILGQELCSTRDDDAKEDNLDTNC